MEGSINCVRIFSTKIGRGRTTALYVFRIDQMTVTVIARRGLLQLGRGREKAVIRPFKASPPGAESIMIACAGNVCRVKLCSSPLAFRSLSSSPSVFICAAPPFEKACSSNFGRPCAPSEDVMPRLSRYAAAGCIVALFASLRVQKKPAQLISRRSVFIRVVTDCYVTEPGEDLQRERRTDSLLSTFECDCRVGRG